MLKKLVLLFVLLNITSQFYAFESDAYKEAMSLYNKGLFGQAALQFELFLRQNSSDDINNPSALYFLAKSHYYLNNNQQSTYYFEKLVKDFPYSPLREYAYYRLGLNYFEHKNNATARYYFSSLIDGFPASEYSGSAQYWVGESYSQEENYTEAIAYFENAISNRPNNKFVDYSIYSLATVYERLGDYKSAVTYYDELISFHRNSPLLPSAQVRIGYCYFRLKEYDASILELSNPKIGTMTPEKQAEALYLLANSMYKTGDYEGAHKIYADIQVKFPSVSFIRELRYAFGWTNFQLKKYADAYKYFNSVSDVEDSLGIESFFWKAESKRYTGNLDEALKIFEVFLQKFPRSEKIQGVRYQLGLISYSEKKYEQAVKFLLGSVTGRDKEISLKSYILLGEIELYRKKYLLADSYFESVASLDSPDKKLVHRAQLGRAISAFHQEKYKISSDLLNTLEQEDPNFEFEKVSFFIAEVSFNLNNYKDALKYYNKIALSDSEFGAFALYGKAYSYYNLSDYKNAVFYFADFLKVYPKEERAEDAALRLGDCYFAIKEYVSAIKIYREILSKKSKKVKGDYISYQLALAYYKAGKIKESLSELNTVSALYSKSEYGENALYLSGWIHFQQANYSAAIDKYLLLINTMPRSRLVPMVLYSVGDAYFNLSNYDSSIAYYNRIITSYSGSTYLFDAINGIQYCYVAMGDLEGAALIIDRYAKQYKNTAFADQLFLKKGEIYYTAGDYNKAIFCYEEFIDIFPSSPLVADALFWIAKSFRNNGKLLEAKQTFRALADRYPSSEVTVSAVVELLSLYSADKNDAESLKIINAVINNFKQSNRYPELLYSKGKILLMLNDQAGAYDLFEETSIYHSENLFGDKSKLELGKLELSGKRYKKAIDVLQKVTSKRTDDLAAEAQYILGIVYIADDKNSEAITAFVRVTNVYSLYDEWVTKSYLKLGEVYEKMGNKNKAREMYKNVITMHPNDEYGKEAQTKLKRIK